MFFQKRLPTSFYEPCSQTRTRCFSCKGIASKPISLFLYSRAMASCRNHKIQVTDQACRYRSGMPHPQSFITIISQRTLLPLLAMVPGNHDRKLLRSLFLVLYRV